MQPQEGLPLEDGVFAVSWVNPRPHTRKHRHSQSLCSGGAGGASRAALVPSALQAHCPLSTAGTHKHAGSLHTWGNEPANVGFGPAHVTCLYMQIGPDMTTCMLGVSAFVHVCAGRCHTFA